MTLSFGPGRCRLVCALYWLCFLAVVCHFWFGSVGVGLVCAGATRWLRGLRADLIRIHRLDLEKVREAWVLPQVMWVSADEVSFWVWRDEIDLVQWARLRRTIRARLPDQALGLTISN